MDSTTPIARPQASGDKVGEVFFKHSSGDRINTDALITKTLKEEYPNLELTAAETYNCNLLGYANAGHASFQLIEDPNSKLPSSIKWDRYLAPARRLDGGLGAIVEVPLFGKFLYKWRNDEFIVYIVDCRDGSYPMQRIMHYILHPQKQKSLALMREAGHWGTELHNEVWVFDGGYWQKSAELYNSIQHASWDNVIMDEEMKKSIIEDHIGFFRARETYAHLKVPWKRGIIYHGPPGNGKTISIKAMMHQLYELEPSVPTLYVRTLASFMGPEAALRNIFTLARSSAPCYLVFEDLDSIVNDRVRSYFLNEVDGLKANDGVFMIGSTNHLDRLDPGISKRPSRFDRKYYFADPNLKERIAYCKFWQGKLKDNKDIEFPDKLCEAIAGITDKFSFAYMQEAFVAALLAIARRSHSSSLNGSSLKGRVWTEELDGEWVGVLGGGDKDDLEELVLWVEIQKQVAILKEGMDGKRASFRKI